MEQVATLAHSGSAGRHLGSGLAQCLEGPAKLAQLMSVEVQVHVGMRPPLSSAPTIKKTGKKNIEKHKNIIKITYIKLTSGVVSLLIKLID